MSYQVIYADPPWTYRDKAKSGDRGLENKYPTMTQRDLTLLPIESIADQDSCILFMWWVGPMPEKATELAEAWGFRVMNMKGFTWVKTYQKKTDKFAIGMGHVTRSNSEDCLIAVKGKLPPRFDASISQVVVAPRLEHSAKPEEVRQRIERLYPDAKKLELFARCDKPIDGWDVFGNQAHGSIEYQPAKFIIP
ncbi:MT-A70 family methyltransferase [Vibrio sp. TBV020]|uniref:MT-A70 family methyltransferase n=1 Tax=Vibrio sp. TBV020 TaxID=3137398 RepID=UPI0038CD9BAE